MSAVLDHLVAPSRRNRSAITNTSWTLPGVDGRSATGRRYRDLCLSLADDLGGADKLSTAQAATVRQLAGVMVEAEGMQASIVRGEVVDREQLVRLANLQTRLIGQLGLRNVKPKDEVPSLGAYLAARGAA